MEQWQKAYLDIETSFRGEITIVGIYRPDRSVVQLVGQAVTRLNVLQSLLGVHEILTYNGHRFDLPVIRRKLGLTLGNHFRSRDLMYDCWARNLYGGLKKVEQRLGIARSSIGIDGLEAMRLWERYLRRDDDEALSTLLLYNREDVLNLRALEARLANSDEELVAQVDVHIFR